MRQALRGGGVAAATIGVLLTGCTSTTAGTGSAVHPITSVSADDFPITGASDAEVDERVRNALVDLNDFWSEAYPEFYDEDLTPLQGGYFSVDTSDIDDSLYPADTGVGCDDLPIDPAEVEGNAFYNTDCDVIVYDTVLLEQLTEQSGAFLPAAVLAHEFGHAMQGRFGFNESSIQDETQADCFSGAFSRWVVDGNAAHTTLRVQDLDKVIVAFLELRDAVGSDPDDTSAHGSGFDRVSGFYEGYDGGVASCRDDFGSDRVFTAAAFDPDDPEDERNGGDAPLEDLDTLVDLSLPPFYESFVSGFEAPTVDLFDGDAPDCGDMGAENRDLGYCESDNTVYLDEEDLVRPAYSDIGDFAVITAIALPYAEAARATLGLSTDDADATRSTVCLTGTFTGRVYSGDFAPTDTEDGVTLSPGDVDEAILFLLRYGQDDKVLPNVEATGFELIGAFRDGFINGAGACDLG